MINGGKGPSDTPMAAPVTTPIIGDNFNSPAADVSDVLFPIKALEKIVLNAG